VIIYAILNHYDKAVKIALEIHDRDLAMQYANKPEDKKIKKKLWMKIAKYLFNYQGKNKNKNMSSKTIFGDAKAQKLSIREAIQIVTDKKRLKIDDLLPLFPPDEKVQDMKDQLCKCLSDYKHSIQELKDNLEDLSENSEKLRNQ
jgi:vacuolar protein sorting-associated protein 18